MMLPSLRRRACDEQVASGGSLVGRDASDPLADHRLVGAGSSGGRSRGGSGADSWTQNPGGPASVQVHFTDARTVLPFVPGQQSPTHGRAGSSPLLRTNRDEPMARPGRHRRHRSLTSPEAETPAGASACAERSRTPLYCDYALLVAKLVSCLSHKGREDRLMDLLWHNPTPRSLSPLVGEKRDLRTK